MSTDQEIAFEEEICEHLGAHGWVYVEGDASKYDRARALFPEEVLAWVQGTQARRSTPERAKRQGGRGGIRTHEPLSRLPVFKTGAFNRSATRPKRSRLSRPRSHLQSTLFGPCSDRPPAAGFDGSRRVLYSLFTSTEHPFRNHTSMGGISNRMKEVKRRRHRRQKLAKFETKAKKATTSEKITMAEKLRKMTPGCEGLIARMGLEERKR